MEAAWTPAGAGAAVMPMLWCWGSSPSRGLVRLRPGAGHVGQLGQQLTRGVFFLTSSSSDGNGSWCHPGRGHRSKK
jgi:hypothetical protein